MPPGSTPSGMPYLKQMPAAAEFFHDPLADGGADAEGPEEGGHAVGLDAGEQLVVDLFEEEGHCLLLDFRRLINAKYF